MVFQAPDGPWTRLPQRESLYRAAGVLSCVRAGRARRVDWLAGRRRVGSCVLVCWVPDWLADGEGKELGCWLVDFLAHLMAG